jgi:hypothetical protein
MMRIVQQSLAEQDVITTLGTHLHMMSGKVANEATTGDEEQVHVVIRQMRKSIECEAIHGYKYRSREAGSFIKLHPVGVVVITVVIRHGTLNYFQTFHLSFYMTGSVKEVSLWELQNNRTNREGRTNVGLMKTIGEGMERPGIGSNHTLIIHSLHNPVQNKHPYQLSQRTYRNGH